jgi:hypothetical protein
MLASFTQTYGDKRKELYDLKNYDKPDIYFRNLLDINFYSFHNCEVNTLRYVTSQEWYKNSKFTPLLYNNTENSVITYPESWRRSLIKMKNMGVKYVFFLQDDVFAFGKPDEYKELVNWVRNNEFNMIQMETNATTLKVEDKPVIYEGEKIKIYSCSNHELMERNNGMWSFDDAPFVANLDYLINIIYDDHYYKFQNIWEAEHYLNYKMRMQKIERNVLSVKLFDRTNIVGANTWNRGPTLKIMYEKLKDYGFPKIE